MSMCLALGVFTAGGGDNHAPTDGHPRGQQSVAYHTPEGVASEGRVACPCYDPDRPQDIVPSHLSQSPKNGHCTSPVLCAQSRQVTEK